MTLSHDSRWTSEALFNILDNAVKYTSAAVSYTHLDVYKRQGGRIHGAVKMAGVWLIPKTAEKPIDGRTKQGKELNHE